MMRYPPVRNVPEVPLPGVGGALANATPEQQRTMLGESVYSLVD
jgi:hypothetical protein